MGQPIFSFEGEAFGAEVVATMGQRCVNVSSLVIWPVRLRREIYNVECKKPRNRAAGKPPMIEGCCETQKFLLLTT